MSLDPDRPRLLAVALLAVAFLVGVLGGIAADRWLLRPPFGHRFEQRERGPARMRQSFEVRLTKELDLSEDQRASVESLLAAQQNRTREIMRRVRPEIDSIATETRDELREILTPAQWSRFEEMRRERRGPGRGPGSRRGGRDQK